MLQDVITGPIMTSRAVTDADIYMIMGEYDNLLDVLHKDKITSTTGLQRGAFYVRKDHSASL